MRLRVWNWCEDSIREREDEEARVAELDAAYREHEEMLRADAETSEALQSGGGGGEVNGEFVRVAQAGGMVNGGRDGSGTALNGIGNGMVSGNGSFEGGYQSGPYGNVA